MFKTETVSRLFIALFLGTAFCAAASAHHNVDLSKTVPITWSGTITKISWDGAHVMYLVDVKADNQAVKSWQVLGASPKILRSRGISQTDFHKGDTVTVIGHLDSSSSIVHPEVFVNASGRRFEMGFYPPQMKR